MTEHTEEESAAGGWWIVAVVGVGLAAGFGGRELLRRRRMTAREAIFAEWEEEGETLPEPVLDEPADDFAATIDLLLSEPRRWADIG